MDRQEQKPSRVLIVEDELVVAADVEGSLQDLGFEVLGVVDNADEAVALASQQRPDIVLMDIQLHGRPGGIRAADQIRRGWNIPVVFLTAYTNEDTMLRARIAGAYGFLTKPFRSEDLNATLRIALQQHRAGQELFTERNWLITMLASLSDGVIAADAGGCVRYINPAAERLTNWSSTEAIGRPIEEVYPLTHFDGTKVPMCQLRRALTTRKPVPKERFLMHVRGDDEIPVEDAAAPIIEDGHLLGAVTIFLDITKRIEAEAEQRQERGRLQEQVQQSTLALGQTKGELRALSGRLINAQEDERRRVARELHDDLGQRAALMGWRVTEMSKFFDALPSEAQRELAALQDDLRHLSAGLREVSHQLHPAVIADLGLTTALGSLVEKQRQQGIEITLVARDVPRELPLEVSTSLYRIAQEAIRNAIRHAPGEPVLVTLSVLDLNLILSVEDPGPGFNVDIVRRSGGLGLLSMQERGRLLGGTVQIRTEPDKGTSIIVTVPLGTSS